MKAKRTTKKALAMLLALVMCLALLPVSVFADGGSGTMPAPDPTSGTVTYAGGSASSTDGNVTISKTAEKVYGTANTFKITLTVSTTDQVTPGSSNAAHVVLVLDRSNSMTKDLATLKSAATSFVTTFLAGSTDNMIGVVDFGRDVIQSCGLTKTAATATTAISKIAIGDSGTYTQGGISKAYDILHADTATVPKIIVLFSDGEPNRYTGSYTNSSAAAIAAAATAKGAGMKIYSVYLDSNGGTTTAVNVMKSISSNSGTDTSYYYEAADASKLAGLFQTISEQITTETDPGTVSDPMGPNINYVAGSLSDSAAASISGSTITWDTSKTTGATTGTTTKTTTRTLTYNVTLDTSAVGFSESTDYPTNGTTTFTYTVNKTAASLNFPIPTVRGTIPEYNYSIEFYQASAGGGYNLVTADTITGGPVDLHTVITAPYGYDDKYSASHFVYDHATDGAGTAVTTTPPSIAISSGTNALKLYYNAESTIPYSYSWSAVNGTDDQKAELRQAVALPSGGAVYSGQTVTIDTTFASGREVDVTGGYYTFSGWYRDEACTATPAVNFSITANTTIYGKWTFTASHGLTYAVSNTASDSGYPAQTTYTGWPDAVHDVRPGGQVTLSTDTVTTSVGTRTVDGETYNGAWTFSGWYSDAACTAANKITSVTMQNADETVYGKWSFATSYSVEYYFLNVAEDSTFTYVYTVPNLSTQPTEDGYKTGTGYNAAVGTTAYGDLNGGNTRNYVFAKSAVSGSVLKLYYVPISFVVTSGTTSTAVTASGMTGTYTGANWMTTGFIGSGSEFDNTNVNNVTTSGTLTAPAAETIAGAFNNTALFNKDIQTVTWGALKQTIHGFVIYGTVAPKTASVTITKTFVGLTPTEIASLTNFKIEVTNGTTSLSDLTLTGKTPSASTADTNTYTYTWTTAAVNYGTTLSIRERDYTLGTSYGKYWASDSNTSSITVGDTFGTATTVGLTNTYSDTTKGTLIITKYGVYMPEEDMTDETAEMDSALPSNKVLLTGVEFSLYSNIDLAETHLLKTATTDASGVASFINLDVGTYYLKETKGIAGFELDPTVYTVTVAGQGDKEAPLVTVRAPYATANMEDGNTADNTAAIWVNNYREYGYLTLTKNIVGASGLTHFVFKVTNNDTRKPYDETVYYTDEKKTDVFVMQDGSIKLYVPTGVYTVKETEAQTVSGYTLTTTYLDNDNGTGAVTNDGIVTVTKAHVEMAFRLLAAVLDNDHDATMTVTNTYTPVGTPTPPTPPIPPTPPTPPTPPIPPVIDIPEVTPPTTEPPIVTITDTETPTAEIVDENTPLGELPQTGEAGDFSRSSLVAAVAALIAGGIAGLAWSTRRKKEDAE